MPEMPSMPMQQLIWMGIVAVVVFVGGAFLLALSRHLQAWMDDRWFKKRRKPNGNGNGGMTHEQAEDLIKAVKENGTSNNSVLKSIESKLGGLVAQTSDIHTIVTEEDKDGFPKMKVMEKKVREIWNKVIRGVVE